jgi:hypothetical protein
MRCHSVGSGTLSRMRSVTQSVTPSIAAVHIALWFAFHDEAGNVIETHE